MITRHEGAHLLTFSRVKATVLTRGSAYKIEQIIKPIKSKAPEEESWEEVTVKRSTNKETGDKTNSEKKSFSSDQIINVNNMFSSFNFHVTFSDFVYTHFSFNQSCGRIKDTNRLLATPPIFFLQDPQNPRFFLFQWTNSDSPGNLLSVECSTICLIRGQFRSG